MQRAASRSARSSLASSHATASDCSATADCEAPDFECAHYMIALTTILAVDLTGSAVLECYRLRW